MMRVVSVYMLCYVLYCTCFFYQLTGRAGVRVEARGPRLQVDGAASIGVHDAGALGSVEQVHNGIDGLHVYGVSCVVTLLETCSNGRSAVRP